MTPEHSTDDMPVESDGAVTLSLVERLRKRTYERSDPAPNGWGYVKREHPDPLCQKAADKIERLHIENIQLKFACGYPMPSELEAHILPSNPFNCGTCDAKSAEIERLRSQGAPDVRERPSPLSPYHEQDDDSIAALASARKGAASDKDAAAIAWAEDEIAALRQAEQAAVRLANELAGKLAKLRSQGGAPEGYVLVPNANNMTDDQAEAIAHMAGCCGGIAYDIYRVALAAAPQPPEGGTGWSDEALADRATPADTEQDTGGERG